MTARLPLLCGDVAWGARGLSMGPYDLVNGYSGPAFPGLDQIHAWGKPFLLGFESATTRAYAGGDAGAVDAQELIGVARTLPGYLEAHCGFWMCAADANSTPAWALGNITDYFRRASLEILSAGWVPARGFGYGNRDAAMAATDGIVAAGLPGDEWGVGTWGYGEGGGTNQLPGDSDAALVQSGNTPGLVDGTDLNAMYQPLDYFGAYGGPAADVPSAPTAPPEDEMLIVIMSLPFGGRLARLMFSDGYKLDQWASDGTPATELNGIPLGVAKAPKGTPLRFVTDNDEALRVLTASNAITTWRDAGMTGGGAGGGVTPIDYAALAKAVNDDAARRMVA